MLLALPPFCCLVNLSEEHCEEERVDEDEAVRSFVSTAWSTMTENYFLHYLFISSFNILGVVRFAFTNTATLHWKVDVLTLLIFLC